MKLLVIEDHPFLRAGLNHQIRSPYPECEVTEADTAEEGLLLALNETFDLILLDLGLPWSKEGKVNLAHGLKVLDILQTLPSVPPVVVMSGATMEETIATARQKGAAAFVSKGRPAAALWETIGRFLPGEKRAPIPAKEPAGLTTRKSSAVTAASLGITPRQFDVLKLSLQGHPSKKIARILAINDSNVRRYQSRLYEKFGVSGLPGLQAHFAKSG